jgi:predicted enzyme related to lactoylglutathione lyase
VTGRDRYPPGVPCWVDTGQPDPDAAVEFYRGVFGWEFEDRMPPGSPAKYFVAQLRGKEVAAVGSIPEVMPQTAAWNTYIWVESADGAADEAKDAGGSVVIEPFDVPGAGRMAVVTDPAGAAFCVWEARGTNGAQLVNEPATWNFSDLYTSDTEGAKAFYGTVFGWEASTIDVGDGGQATMWRAPGYGDFLERTADPDIRARQEEVQAPPGFEDAIGWLVPLDYTPFPESRPFWHVTFSVSDADATAERAAELGGEVVTPPTDMPWVRLASLRDPQGAPFTVGKFQPPE